MSRSITSLMILSMVVLLLAACTPVSVQQVAGTQPTPIVQTVEAPQAVPTPAVVELPRLKVSDVQMQIGVGSPIPVDAFISGELPDLCAQLADAQVTHQEFAFDITLHVTPGTREECFRDTVPFRLAVPLNMINHPDGSYTVNVNGVTTTFQWPSQPNVMPDSGMTVPAEWETYRNDAIYFEIDYPPGWIVDEGGDTDILWSEKPSGPGQDGVPNHVVKIDIVTDPKATLTLDELVAQQKRVIADNNGKVLQEEAITLGSGLPAVRMGVSGFAESVALLSVINGHPVMLVGYGNLAGFDEVARTLRSVEP